MATSSYRDTVNISATTEGHAVSLDSIPLYNFSKALWKVCTPAILLLGVFGNAMTLIIMRRMTSSFKDSSIFPLYFTSIAIADLAVLLCGVFTEWINQMFHYQIYEVHATVCKALVWLQTGSGTAGCWYIVLLSLHRAVSVVWPHRVNVLCTRRLVVVLLSVITVCLAGLYSHYLYGFELLDPSVDTSHRCLMRDEAYIQFVVDVFVYVELVIYCLLPFVCLVLANGVLVWKLTTSVTQAPPQPHRSSEQALAREKVAQSVTLTVTVVSLTFLLLTLPLSVYYVMSYMTKQYTEATGQEYVKLYFFSTMTYILAYCNSAVNFYLYCLTGRKFREEFLKVMLCWEKGAGEANATETSAGRTVLCRDN